MKEVMVGRNYKKSLTEGCFFFYNEDGEVISPVVNRIMYDLTSDLYLFEDRLVIDEFNVIPIFYYADCYGNLFGMCYVGSFDEFVVLNYKTTKDLASEYALFKFELANKLRTRIFEKEQRQIDNAKKLALNWRELDEN